MPKKISPAKKRKKKVKIEIMTASMLKEKKDLDPMKLVQLVFDFYTMPLE